VEFRDGVFMLTAEEAAGIVNAVDRAAKSVTPCPVVMRYARDLRAWGDAPLRPRQRVTGVLLGAAADLHGLLVQANRNRSLRASAAQAEVSAIRRLVKKHVPGLLEVE
jgi:hypothetical protein